MSDFLWRVFGSLIFISFTANLQVQVRFCYDVDEDQAISRMLAQYTHPRSDFKVSQTFCRLTVFFSEINLN